LARFPWLADHRVHGRVVVPGAFQLACLVGAWQALHGPAPCRIAGLTFARPMVVPDDGALTLWTLIAPDGAARLVSGDADRPVPHADATIAALAAGNGAAADLDAARGRCPDVVDPERWRMELSRIGIAI